LGCDDSFTHLNNARGWLGEPFLESMTIPCLTMVGVRDFVEDGTQTMQGMSREIQSRALLYWKVSIATFQYNNAPQENHGAPMNEAHTSLPNRPVSWLVPLTICGERGLE